MPFLLFLVVGFVNLRIGIIYEKGYLIFVSLSKQKDRSICFL